MNDTPQLEAPAPVEDDIFDQARAMPRPLVVRMDRSRELSEVHGDRMSGDPYADVFFFQNGLPFDSQFNLLWDTPLVQKNALLKARAEKLLKRAMKLNETAPGDLAEGEESGDGDDEEEYLTLADLAKWAAEQKNIVWQDISNFIARKYSIRITNKKAALELLVEKQVVSPNSLSKKNRKLLDAE